MGCNAANGTIITFAGAPLVGLRGVNYQEGGADVDVSAMGDSVKTYESGLSDVSVSVDILGTVSVSKGDKGAFVCTWPDGTSDGSITSAIVSSVSTSGSMDSEITSNVVFKPAGECS